MKKLLSLFIKYPFYSNTIIAIIILAGSVSLLSLKKSFFPEIPSRNIIVTVAYPGASPKEMEEGITIRVEEALRGIVGIKEINSTSSENFANIKITTTGEYDIDETLAEVKNAVDGISSMPIAAEKPIIRKQRFVTKALFLGLSGDIDLQALKKYADEIEYDLYRSGVMSQITIMGYPKLELSVEVSENNLRRYNLTFDEIQRAISNNNRDISGGIIKSKENEMLIRIRSRSVNPRDIEQIIIRANNDGSYLKIKDIAKVYLQFEDVSSSSKMNRKTSISFKISKLANEDLQKISEFCKNYVKKFNEKHRDATLYVTYDFLEMLSARLNLLYKNGGIGLLLILITLGFFLSFRLSLWVAWGIPTSLLAMFVLAAQVGITINMFSLFGMILVVGILVDDGIVIAENIYAHFEKGKSPKRAALDGTMEVLPAVFTSVATTIVAFIPLMLIKNGRMQFLYDMAFVVIFSLGFSLLEAFFVLPVHLGNKYILRANKKRKTGLKIRQKLDTILIFMRDKMYGRSLRFIIKWKYVFLISPIAFFLITIGLLRGGLINVTIFPSIPFDQFNVNIAFKPGTGEQKTLEYLDRFDKIIWEVNADLMKEKNDTSNFVNFTFVSTGSAFNGQEKGSHAGNILVLLRDLENTDVSSNEIVIRIRKKIGKLPEVEKFTVSGKITFGTPISISLLGKNLKQLKSAKIELMNQMSQIAAINNITENNSEGKQEILLKLKAKAYFLGLNRTSLANQVRQGFFGGQAQRLQQGKDELRVWVRFPKAGRLTIGQLENMKIKTKKGEYPLSELATYVIKRGPTSIKRFNGSREIRVNADMVNPKESVIPIMNKLKEEILPKILKKYPTVRYENQGQARAGRESMTDFKKYFSIAFIIMVFIIMIHFKSATQGIIILMMIPLAWLGAIWGHGIENISLSMLSVWGMVALSGVIINDALVFLSKYNSLLLEGNKVEEAVYKAGTARFRAIVLTTLTTSVGLYPIILETSFQAQFLRPMAVSLAYGVFIGTAFILIFFPVLILVLNDFRRWIFWIFFGGEKRKAEEVEKAIIYSKKVIE
jgi:multidrug efflux pump subunit AcrB